MEDILPAALLMGVPYDLFWHLNPRKLEPFRTAYKDRLSQEDYYAWRQGAYKFSRTRTKWPSWTGRPGGGG